MLASRRPVRIRSCLNNVNVAGFRVLSPCFLVRSHAALAGEQRPYMQTQPCWVIIGPPGSGKGTYAKLLSQRFNLDHFSTGDLARDGLTDPSLRRLMEAGTLLPDEAIVPLFLERLKAVPASAFGVLLDGFPRTLKQAELLETLRVVDLALEIQIKDEHIMAKTAGRRKCANCGAGYNIADVCDHVDRVFMPPILPASASSSNFDTMRCTCGGSLHPRIDDAPSVVAARLKSHHSHFDPIIDWYRDRNVLMSYRVHQGVGDMDELSERIVNRISPV